MNWLDLAVLIIIGLSVLHGLRTGLIRGLAKITGLIAGLSAAYYGYSSLAVYLNQQWGLGDSIATFLLERLPLPLWQGWAGGGYQTLPGSPGSPGATMVLSELSQRLAVFSLEIISFVLILLVVSKLVTMLFRMISGVTSGTPLGLLDRLGGLLLGFARGILIVMILVLLIQPFTTVGAQTGNIENSPVPNAMANSILIPYFTATLDLLNLHFKMPAGVVPPARGDVI